MVFNVILPMELDILTLLPYDQIESNKINGGDGDGTTNGNTKQNL